MKSVVGLEDLLLQVGDRLETTSNLQDVGDVWNLSVFPVCLKFWRRANETIASRRCSLFDEALGITPDESVCADILHSFHLGIVLEFVKLAIWKLISAGSWGSLDGNADESLRLIVLNLRGALWDWYDIRAKTHPTEVLTRLADLVPTMLGTSSNPKLKTKAAETWGLLLFTVDTLAKFAHRIGADAVVLNEAGGLLVHYMEVLRGQGNRLSESARQDIDSTPGLDHMLCSL